MVVFNCWYLNCCPTNGGPFGSFWTILDHMGPYGTTLDHFELIWQLWTILRCFRLLAHFQSIVYYFERKITNFNYFVPIQTFWTILDHLGLFSTYLDYIGPYQKKTTAVLWANTFFFFFGKFCDVLSKFCGILATYSGTV